tara:strand:+ start:2170 stop:3540 length:1371 start_codon:yes stop_codon:yes gene_type:complete
MKKKIILFTLLTLVAYLVINNTINKNSFTKLKNYMSSENKFLIKKFFFPYKYISQLENEILQNKSRSPIHNVFFAVKKELDFKKSLNDFKTKEKKEVKLSNNKVLSKYELSNFFHAGINHTIPGSGYIDFHNNNLFVLSARGILGYSKNFDNEITFKQVKNNLNDFIGLEQFYKKNWFSFKDLLIHDDNIFVSYTEEIKEDCWNTSLVFGKLDYDGIKFNKLFSSNNCIHSKNNIDKEFNAHQSGGRVISFDDNHVLLSLGDYRSRFLAQNKDSVNGKIIKINLKDKSYKVFSMGHRNPQGLLFDKKNNIIFETEHGPKGGDEINLINLAELDDGNIPNYGWPISSAGKHYKDPNGDKYKKYPLYKSHSKYGFIEPLKSFVPSIAISEIVKIGEKKYALGSMSKRTLYYFKLDNENKIINFEEIKIFERIRDLKFYNNKLYLLLEDTPSIGIISLK